MSTELMPSSRRSDEPEAAGEADDWSLSAAGVPSAFMETRTEAASSSCTCWCFEIRSFEVMAHSGVCSQLQKASIPISLETLTGRAAVRSTLLSASEHDNTRCVCKGQAKGYPQVL